SVAIRRREPDLLKQFVYAVLSFRPVQLAMYFQRFGDDACHSPTGVETGVGVLKNHLQTLPQLSTFSLMQHRNGMAVEFDLPAGWGVKAHEQTCHGGLPAT